MRILIADDHALFRDGLKSLLESRGFEIIGEARNGREAVEMAGTLNPELLLMDVSMPEIDGIEATRQVTAAHPDIKVVVLTASENDATLFEALKAGASGYLMKNLEADEFFTLLEAAGRGEPALTPLLANRVLQEFARGGQSRTDPDELTTREREVLELMAGGVTSNRRLARKLEVSENTVKFHVRNILDKLRLHSRAEAVGYALRKGIVRSD